nr:MAG: internal scaffolding protein [Microviridae sp.]
MFKSDAKERSDASRIDCNDYDLDTGELLLRTRQEFKDECDMNKIIARYTPELLIESYNAFKGTFGDATEVSDYAELRDQVLATEEWFDSLPAKIRSMFDNQVSNAVDYLENEANFDEAVKLGLLVKPNVLEADKAPTSVSLDVTGGTDTISDGVS